MALFEVCSDQTNPAIPEHASCHPTPAKNRPAHDPTEEFLPATIGNTETRGVSPRTNPSHRPPLEAATASQSPAASSVRRFTPRGFAAAAVGASLLRGVGSCACAMGLRVAKVRSA